MTPGARVVGGLHPSACCHGNVPNTVQRSSPFAVVMVVNRHLPQPFSKVIAARSPVERTESFMRCAVFNGEQADRHDCRLGMALAAVLMEAGTGRTATPRLARRLEVSTKLIPAPMGLLAAP